MLLFRWRGVPVVANRLFVLLAVGWLCVQGLHDGVWGVVMGLTGVVLLFGSVLLHELGHAIVAQRFGVRVREITLNVFGGVTVFERVGLSPRVDFYVSLGGPAVSLLLAALFAVIGALAHAMLFDGLALANLSLGLFNLLPAFPLDGGRVLRALLEMRLGVLRGSRIALGVGTVLASMMFAIGVWLRSPSVIVVAMLLLFMQREERVRLGSSVVPAWR